MHIKLHLKLFGFMKLSKHIFVFIEQTPKEATVNVKVHILSNLNYTP